VFELAMFVISCCGLPMDLHQGLDVSVWDIFRNEIDAAVSLFDGSSSYQFIG
jgi:hypothetical protein